jgi:DUF2917 family protein
MIFLEAFKAMRIEAPLGARVSCVSGVLWVTQEGDLRDLIVAPGESLEVGRGVTVAVALEPAVMKVVEHRPSSRVRGMLARLRIATLGSGASTAASHRPSYDTPHVSPYI